MSQAIADRLNAQARINPIQPQNRVQHVTRLESGNLQVRLYSGRSYEIDKTDDMFQAFAVYTILAEV